MPLPKGDELRIVVRVLLFTALVLVVLGGWLLATSDQPLLGALVLGAGLADAAMAWGLQNRG
jgi:hypothetical protein